MKKDLYITKVWVDDNYVYAETRDGLQAKYAFSDWNRLSKATPEQRRDFKLSYFGIHWPQIDEDLSFEGMFSDNHPEMMLRENDITVCYNE